MKIALLSLLLATAVSAEEVKTCRTKFVPGHTVTVCPIRHKKPKPVLVMDPLEVKGDPTPDPVVVVVPLHEAPVKPDWEFGIRAAVGLATMDPHIAGEVGMRAHYFPAHLALDGYTDFHYGYALQLLVYPYQGESLLWHVNAGILWPVYGAYLDVVDVNRNWDLTLGTGLEVPLLRWLSFTADYRLNFANPAYIGNHATPARNAQGVICNAPYISPGNYVGNSLLGGRVWVGLMVHTW